MPDTCDENLAMAAARPICDEAKTPRRLTNCERITELADELWRLDRDYKRLEQVIKADPRYIPDSQKALWPEQFKAMGDYKMALKKRIIDLINTDN